MTNGFGSDDPFDAPAPEASGPTVGVVRVGKRDYAIGLHWSSIQNPSKAADEARAMASDEDFRADLYCIRMGSTPQFGLGSKAAGHKVKMPSLAAHLASSKMGSWIGVFAVPGGWYLVAVRDDGILSECDRFIRDEDAARDVLESYAGQSTWGAVIAPKSMDIPGSVEALIEDTLDGKPPVSLVDARQTSNAVKFGMIAIMILGVVFAVMYYQDSIRQAELAAEAQRLLDEARAATGTGPEEVQIPDMPWVRQAKAAAAVTACADKAGLFRTDIPGWRFKEADCAGTGMAVTLERRGNLGNRGTPVTWIKPFVGAANIDYGPSGTGQIAAVSVDLGEIPTYPPDIRTVPKAVASRAIQEVLENRYVPVTLTAADENEFWRGVQFSFKTKEDPKGFADLLTALPGVIMTRIHLDAASAEWTLEGKVYEQLPQPEKPGQQPAPNAP